ncbi:MAG: flagellar biosynthetic protein FliO [Spirochaetales bacterium]|uniref:Flagellar protein n=1 Tax=Candidatus Thalassospirochaeta sargassi TaxID=3119039 RepID=A0AAJ1IK51_9SPIO|nr:flagellar biosynthetic protein FliO [Spirochaetales bacterium]
MKKLITATAIILVAAVTINAQAADENSDRVDFTDETTIILEDTAVDPAAETTAGEGSFFTTWDFVKVILILVAVIFVIYGIFYALKRSGGLKFQNDELIRLLGSQSLTQNGSVHLIEVGAKYYLVGCGDGSVSHIADIDDKETVDEIILKRPPEEEHKKSFIDFFNLKMGRKENTKANMQDKITNNNKFMHDQAERLKKM